MNDDTTTMHNDTGRDSGDWAQCLPPQEQTGTLRPTSPPLRPALHDCAEEPIADGAMGQRLAEIAGELRIVHQQLGHMAGSLRDNARVGLWATIVLAILGIAFLLRGVWA
jgi:hypothetical protein